MKKIGKHFKPLGYTANQEVGEMTKEAGDTTTTSRGLQQQTRDTEKVVVILDVTPSYQRVGYEKFEFRNGEEEEQHQVEER